MKGRRLWLKIKTQGTEIPVYVVKTLIDTDTGHELAGEFDAEKPAICIRQIENTVMMRQSLHHEIMHVVFSANAGSVKERILRSKSPDTRFDREEDIVAFLEPGQFELLASNGWLKYPKPPRVA